MKVGYPCINRSIGCTANKTFRLASYSEDRFKKTIEQNLECLQKTLEYNLNHNLLFFRIGSPIVPFASHPVCIFDWKKYFKNKLKKIGDFIKENNFRISMHPDQFVIINSFNPKIIERSIEELRYHADFLNMLGLDKSAKMQIHIGGVYGDKKQAIERFVSNYQKLPKNIKDRLVIENDHINYSLKDCLLIHKQTHIPIVFDFFHHECLNNGESTKTALIQAIETWDKDDGIPMTDYSTQKQGANKGSHSESIDVKKFKLLLKKTRGLDFDIMLEIKDKEKSALKAAKIVGIHKKI